MNPLTGRMLADENVNPAVVRALRERGHDVVALLEVGTRGMPDTEVLRIAHALARVVVTHDADFGTFAVREGAPFIGIIYLRPGVIDVATVLAMFDRVAALDVRVEGSFVLVAELRGSEVRVRFRPVEIRG